MPLHHLTLKLTSPPPSPGGQGFVSHAPKVELLLDGKPLGGVQKLTLTIDAVNMLPTVILSLVPGQIDVEVDGEADVAKAWGEIQRGLLFDLQGNVAAVSDGVSVGPGPGQNADAPSSVFQKFDELFDEIRAGEAANGKTRLTAHVGPDGTPTVVGGKTEKPAAP